MSEMFSWINNVCADSTTSAETTFSPFVSSSGVDAGADFGRMLGAVVPCELRHVNEKSMYKLLQPQPWTVTENAVNFQPPGVKFVGPGGDGVSSTSSQFEGSNHHHGFWSAYAGALVQAQHVHEHRQHQSISKQQQQQQQFQHSSAAKLDSVPATPPLLSDIVTLVCSSASTTFTAEGCDKVAAATQLTNGFATFMESLPNGIPYGASTTVTAPAGIIQSQSNFSFGKVNSTCSAAAGAADADMESAIRPPKLEPGKSDAQTKSGTVHSLDGGKDDQIKKVLTKCGKWAESAMASKSLEWTTVVDVEKTNQFHGRPTKKTTEGPAAATAPRQQQHRRSFRPVPCEKAEHVQRERERRIQLRAMYKTLDALVPAQSRTAKRDRTTIVNDALNYVKEMRRKLEKLQDYKSKSVMTIALSELIAQKTEKRNNTSLRDGDPGKTLSPSSTSAVEDVEHREGNALLRTDETVEASIAFATPDVHVFTGSKDQVLINIHCGSRPYLLSRALKALDLLQLDVSHYTFSRLCPQFVSCHFVAKIHATVDISGLTETIKEVLVDSLR